MNMLLTHESTSTKALEYEHDLALYKYSNQLGWSNAVTAPEGGPVPPY